MECTYVQRVNRRTTNALDDDDDDDDDDEVGSRTQSWLQQLTGALGDKAALFGRSIVHVSYIQSWTLIGSIYGLDWIGLDTVALLSLFLIGPITSILTD